MGGPKPVPVAVRLAARLLPVGDCLLYTGKLDRDGYGTINERLDVGRFKSHRVHRLAYKLAKGPIPDGLEIDHRCHRPRHCDLKAECPHRRCCNPDHLEVVEHRENCQRSTHALKVEAYRQERARQEADLDAACIGYETERAMLLEEYGPLITLKEWLVMHSRPV